MNLKPKAYIETSIVSYLTAKPTQDIRVAANQGITREWWEARRLDFGLFISEFVVAEASLGDPEAASRRPEVIDDIAELEATEAVRRLGRALISEGPIPPGAEIDAYHIAIAAVHGMEYLLTGNCTHIANAAMRPKIEWVCREHGFEPPIICTPQELMEG
jgi:hypothetical protein